jgi:hypothetical protein
MQTREELKHKGHDRSKKTMCCEKGKNIIFKGGQGINTVIGQKHRQVQDSEQKIPSSRI